MFITKKNHFKFKNMLVFLIAAILFFVVFVIPDHSLGDLTIKDEVCFGIDCNQRDTFYCP